MTKEKGNPVYKLAAIDIGSNAGRLLIANVYQFHGIPKINKLQLVRVPLRLGEEVFSNNKLSPDKIQQLVRSVHAFKLLMEAYGVDEFRACATSAMRESENREEVVQAIKSACDVEVEVIDGKKEADLILNTFLTQDIEKSHHYLYIDVGGGSTEISLIYDDKKIASHSFRLGTLRLMNEQDDKSEWKRLKNWLKELKINGVETTAIGTGGNINKLYKLSDVNRKSKIMFRDELKAISKYVKSHTFEERVELLGLRPDRADVIVPAAKIYLSVLKYAAIERMIVPKIGLADGIAYDLYCKLTAD